MSGTGRAGIVEHTHSTMTHFSRVRPDLASPAEAHLGGFTRYVSPDGRRPRSVEAKRSLSSAPPSTAPCTKLTPRSLLRRHHIACTRRTPPTSSQTMRKKSAPLPDSTALGQHTAIT